VRGEEAVVDNAAVPEIQPIELACRLKAGEDLFILDVREPHEYHICNLHGYLIPLRELPQRMHELDPGRTIVAHCKAGARSAQAVELLRRSGFQHVTSLAGGIIRWAEEVDSTLPKY
jgi:adenylyltransferase/sulfurtransferase